MLKLIDFMAKPSRDQLEGIGWRELPRRIYLEGFTRTDSFATVSMEVNREGYLLHRKCFMVCGSLHVIHSFGGR